ncbi:MAG: hypothetical protein PHI73_03990 [Patescibacteria group bacterium]|nr:hypothetical protein [Patescibacteria group bacterium]
MNFKKTLPLIIVAFISYLIGRWSHVWLNDWAGNPTWAPHHWIYGALLIILGLTFRKKMVGKMMLAFGAGLFLSDLIDFLHFRILSPDPLGEKHFWGID